MKVTVIASHPKARTMQLQATVNVNNDNIDDTFGPALVWQIGDMHGMAYSEIDAKEKIAAALTEQGWTDIKINL